MDERNHLRLWLTPLTDQGKDVWIGQISRGIGVRLSSKTFVTHKIDPQVEEACDYLVQDLLLSGSPSGFGYVGGVGQCHWRRHATTTRSIRILPMGCVWC